MDTGLAFIRMGPGLVRGKDGIKMAAIFLAPSLTLITKWTKKQRATLRLSSVEGGKEKRERRRERKKEKVKEEREA